MFVHTWAEVDSNKKWDGRNKCGPDLQAPGDCSDIVNREVSTKAQENTTIMPLLVLNKYVERKSIQCSPHLPRHDQSSSNHSWRVLCRKNWDGGALETHSDTHE